MTDLATPESGLVSPAVSAAALAAATAAAAASRVEIRDLTEVSDLTEVCRLFASIWQPGAGAQPVTTELLRAMAAAGNYIAGAYEGDELLGACLGFFGSPAKASLHSHIAGVAPRGLGRGIGFSLKLHQRAWALRQHVSLITWTFDPWCGGTHTSTWPSSASIRHATCPTSTGRCATASTARVTPTG